MKLISVLDYELSPTEFDSDASELEAILTRVSPELKKDCYSLQLFISDMAQFPAINACYRNHFGRQPPVRVCVALPRQHPRVQVSMTSG